MSEEMNQDIQKLKKDMAEVRATERGIAAALTRIEVKVDGIAEEMATKTELRAVRHQIESFTGLVEASRAERKISDETFSDVRKTLQDHEARLIRLEPKKS